MIGREQELQRLRDILDGPGPGLTWVTGFAGAGVTALVRHVTRNRPSVWIRGSPLPPELAGLEMEAGLREQVGEHPDPGPGPSAPDDTGPWTGTFRILGAVADLPDPPVLVVDDADPLLQDRRFVRRAEALWTHLRAHGRRQHILVLSTGATTPEGWIRERSREGDRARPAGPQVPVGPIPLREAASTVPGWSAREVVTAYALVGGLPGFWSRVDSRMRPETNLQRLLLAPDGACRRAAEDLVPHSLRGQARTLALLRALAGGATSWGELREAARVFRSSSELGPYMKGLVEAGLVEARRSLDAAPRSRNRRYRLVHPLHAFWYGSVHPRLARLDAGVPTARVLTEALAPEIPGLVRRRLPSLLQEYLLRHGDERFPARAREVGSVWGDGYDLDVAATLRSGAAVYGQVWWGGPPPPPEAMDRLGEQIRQARYGFGREARLRFLLVREEASHELARRTARLPGGYLLDAADLVGRR